MSRRVLFAVPALVAALAAGLPGVAAAAPARHAASVRAHPRASVTHAPGSYVPVRPFHLPVKGSYSLGTQTLTVKLAGTNGIPGNAAAAALTVHAIAPTTDGSLAVVPHGSTKTTSLALSFQANKAGAQPTVVRLVDGQVDIVNQTPSASMKIAVDVSGYYAGGTVGRGDPGRLHLLAAPIRATGDSRLSLPAHGVKTFQVGNGVPSSGVGAVAVALTTFAAPARGTLIAYANGNDQPSLPTASFAAHQTATTFAWVPTDSAGSISIANTASQRVAIAVDVVGWTDAGVVRTAGALEPRYPDRLVNHLAQRSYQTTRIRVAGAGGVPLSGVRAAIVQLTASGAEQTGHVVAWPAGSAPGTNALDFAPRRTDSAVVAVPLSDGKIYVRNRSKGSVNLTADVVGFVPSTDLTPPRTSISRYLGDLTGNLGSDRRTMARHGCSDGKAMSRPGSRFVLLDVGAQSRTGRLAAQPGVSLTQTVKTVRLTYLELVTRLQSYIDSFARCSGGKRVTIAIGTNNDGAWNKQADGKSYYGPAARGRDWAYNVVNMITSAPGVTAVGADDIEPGFASSEAQALTWEQSYLDAANSKRLIFNGSADGCPDAFGVATAVCTRDYTQKGLYHLATYKGQVTAVPQIYGPSMAAQWANIDKVGGGGIRFGGVLTEHPLAPDQYTPANGWAALFYALASVGPKPTLPAVSDITSG